MLNIIIINKTEHKLYFKGNMIRRWQAFGFEPHRGKYEVYNKQGQVTATFKVNINGLAHDVKSPNHMADNSLILDMHNRICRHGIVVKIMQSGYGNRYKILTNVTLN